MGGQEREIWIWICGVVISENFQEWNALMRAGVQQRVGFTTGMASVHDSKRNGLDPCGAGFGIRDQENIGRSRGAEEALGNYGSHEGPLVVPKSLVEVEMIC